MGWTLNPRWSWSDGSWDFICPKGLRIWIYDTLPETPTVSLESRVACRCGLHKFPLGLTAYRRLYTHRKAVSSPVHFLASFGNEGQLCTSPWHSSPTVYLRRATFEQPWAKKTHHRRGGTEGPKEGRKERGPALIPQKTTLYSSPQIMEISLHAWQALIAKKLVPHSSSASIKSHYYNITITLLLANSVRASWSFPTKDMASFQRLLFFAFYRNPLSCDDWGVTY